MKYWFKIPWGVRWGKKGWLVPPIIGMLSIASWTGTTKDAMRKFRSLDLISKVRNPNKLRGRISLNKVWKSRKRIAIYPKICSSLWGKKVTNEELAMFFGFNFRSETYCKKKTKCSLIGSHTWSAIKIWSSTHHQLCWKFYTLMIQSNWNGIE